jgi:hypothetical protein
VACNEAPAHLSGDCLSAIKIYKGIDPEMFIKFDKHSEQALLETATAQPDIKAIIAERVEAGEVFTAAQAVARATNGDRARLTNAVLFRLNYFQEHLAIPRAPTMRREFDLHSEGGSKCSLD